MATNNARDNLKKRDYFERFGIAGVCGVLLKIFPSSHACRRVSTPMSRIKAKSGTSDWRGCASAPHA